ncbi:MAG: hypothetical protein ACJ789_18385 [Thermomicrobiales bacterium]
MTNDDSGSNGGVTEKNQGSSPPRSRLETEVLEILERSERPIPFGARVRRITWRRRRDRVSQSLTSPIEYVRGQGSRAIAIAAIVCAILALFLNNAAPIISRVAGLAFIVLIAIFFFVGFKSPPGGSGSKRWRGRDVDFDSSRGNDEGRFRGPWRR